MSNILIFPKTIFFRKIRELFLNYLEIFGVSPKIKHIGFGNHGHVRKSYNHANDAFSGSPIMKRKNHESKMKQNNPTELLDYSFPYMDYKNAPKTTKMP